MVERGSIDRTPLRRRRSCAPNRPYEAERDRQMISRFRILAFGGFVAFVSAALTVGCGVKSPPVPPQAARPTRIVNLHAASVKDGVRLVWGRPATYEAGGKMRNLGYFSVLRSESPGSFKEIGEVPVTDQQRFQQQQAFSYIDSNTTVGNTYSYQIVSFTQDDYKSSPSNTATIERTVPRPP